MAEPLATAPGRIPAPPGGATAAGPVEADAPRRSGAFVTAADRRRYAVVVAVLAAVAVLSTGGTACTPQQTQGAFDAIGRLITLILYAYAMGQSHPVQPGLPPTTAPPVTLPEPVGT